MKIGTHNLGQNAFSSTTVVKVDGGGLTIRQIRGGVEENVILSTNQIALLKDILA